MSKIKEKFVFSTGLPTEPVGSLPRPSYLQEAAAKFDTNEISKEEFIAVQDKAAKESIAAFEKTGSPLIADGEQRKSSFATYPLLATLGGQGFNESLTLDYGQKFATFIDGHTRALPGLAKGPFKYASYSSDTSRETAKVATVPFKEAVIAPSMLSLLYPVDKELEGYSKEQFETDLVNECQKDIRQAFHAGASRVSIDFTEGRLALKNDSSNPWTTKNLIDHFVDLNNRVLDGFSPEERANIGVHTCPGGDTDSVHSAEVPYNSLFPKLFRIKAGYFLIQCATEEDKEQVYKDISASLPKELDGVKPIAFIGVISTINSRVETVEEIKDELIKASKYIPLDQLGSTDDCGFSPFSIDDKPTHGGADKAREIAFQKIANRIEGTKLAAKELGLI